MTGVTQTDTSRTTGNCLQASVASLLDLPLGVVPHFVLHDDWEILFMDFLEEYGFPVKLTAPGPGVTGIAIGDTVRDTRHAVVMVDGEVEWDPHPSRAGLTTIAHVYAINTS